MTQWVYTTVSRLINNSKNTTTSSDISFWSWKRGCSDFIKINLAMRRSSWASYINLNRGSPNSKIISIVNPNLLILWRTSFQNSTYNNKKDLVSSMLFRQKVTSVVKTKLSYHLTFHLMICLNSVRSTVV